jgi:serine/threonine protein kinase
VPQPSIKELVKASAALARAPKGTRVSSSPLDSWTEAEWRAVLLDIPMDDGTFEVTFEITRQALIAVLWRWWSNEKRTYRGKADGYLGFFLLTLIAMHCSDGMRFGDGVPEPIVGVKRDPAELSGQLVQNEQVREAIEVLYDPHWKDGRRLNPKGRAAAAITPNVRARWANIDFSELSFHRSGTTSIIFRGRTRGEESNGARPEFALKCVIYPYQRIEAITEATKAYREDYKLESSQVERIVHLVPVWASYDAWVLMDFIDGPTLAEVLAKADAKRTPPKREVARTVDFEQLNRLGTALFAALMELEEHDRRHGDLSPSNIIVEDEGGETPARLRLIDLGVNYLHTRSMSGGRGDAVYVAPETRRTGKSGDLADIYSLGRLLIAIGGVPLNPDGTVPDAYYAHSVGLARLLEDLVDEEADHRLTVVAVDKGKEKNKGEDKNGKEKAEDKTKDEDEAKKLIPQITPLFKLEMAIARAGEEAVEEGAFARFRALTPGKGQMKRQKKILEVLEAEAKDAQRREAEAKDPDRPQAEAKEPNDLEAEAKASYHLKQARRLRRWALVCTWCVLSAFLVILTALARDVGYEWLVKPVEIASNIAGREDGTIPVLDDVRAADYPIKDFWGSLPARIVALSFIVVGARWYLNILADLTPGTASPRTGRGLALTRFNECAMRMAAILPALYVTLPTVFDRDWWPLFSAIGVTSVAIVNTSCLLFARDAFRRAREAGLSTVPKIDTTAMAKFAPWTPTSWFYSVPVWSIGTLLLLDRLQDELVYAIFVTTINIAMWYVIKCGIEAPYVRIALARSYLAAERLDRREQPVPEPPKVEEKEQEALVGV